jgi:hypothetical protein
MGGGLSLPWKLTLDVTAPIVTLLLAWMSIKNNSRAYFLGALVVALVATLVQVVDRWMVAREERTVRELTNTLIAYLIDEIQRASTMEQRVRGDMQADQRFTEYRNEIEDWRTGTGHDLERLLPRTGASQVFLAALGQTGHGPLYWEYTQLRGCQEALVSILGSVGSFVRRSRANQRAKP